MPASALGISEGVLWFAYMCASSKVFAELNGIFFFFNSL